MAPGVEQINSKGDPPDEIVRQAKNGRAKRPAAGENEFGKSDGPENFPEEPDRRQVPSRFGTARDLEVEKSVNPDDHPQTREYFRVIEPRHFCEIEKPVGKGDRKNPPDDIVNPGK